jgi:hypothetical protein
MQDLLGGQNDKLGASPEVTEAACALVGELPQAALRLCQPRKTASRAKAS